MIRLHPLDMRPNFILGSIAAIAFYAPPQIVAGYYVIPSELLSVRPSAVDQSCPLHNYDTVQDNFTKLGKI